MAVEDRSSRRVSKSAAKVLDRLARERRSTLVLDEDRPWLKEITPDPADLLYRMRLSHTLYRIGRGRYVVAPAGATRVRQAASPETMADLRLQLKTPYFVSFLSALIAHGLTDVQSPTLYLAVPAENKLRRSSLPLAGREAKLVSLSSTRWPADNELETVRAAAGSMDTYRRATVERALVDALHRPDNSGGIELVANAWARAHRMSEVDWDRVAEIGRAYSADTSRRVAFMLFRLGRPEQAETALDGKAGRGAKVLFDRSDDFGLRPDDCTRDARTGVIVNVPQGYLDAWVAESG